MRSAIVSKIHKVLLVSGNSYFAVGSPSGIRATFDSEPEMIDDEMPDSIKSVRFHHLSIEQDGKVIQLTPKASKAVLAEKRFIDRCACRPIVNAVTSSVLVSGEDDCPVHGFTDEHTCWECDRKTEGETCPDGYCDDCCAEKCGNV